MSNRSYAILGTGAIGGYYGACLQHAGLEVHFLLRSDYEHVLKQGLVIESINGDFTLPQVNAYNDVAKMPACDVVIVALKTTQNHLLSQLLPPLVKEDSTVLLLQNGLGAEPQVAQLVENNCIMGGLCFICSHKLGPGHIRHLDYNPIAIGAYSPNYQPCGITETMHHIAADFEAAGIHTTLAEDLLLARWKKLVWNIPYNGLSVVLDARTDEMMANPDVRRLVKDLMQEVVEGANSCNRALFGGQGNRPINDSFIQQMLDHTDQMKPYLTSMKLDYDARRPLELEAIFAYPLQMAAAAGADLKRIRMLYEQLTFLDDRNCKNVLG